jgi:hypothetical protein
MTERGFWDPYFGERLAQRLGCTRFYWRLRWRVHWFWRHAFGVTMPSAPAIARDVGGRYDRRPLPHHQAHLRPLRPAPHPLR